MKPHLMAVIQAPPRADVVKSLKNGVGLNLLGMGAAILGMQATVGLLFTKVLTTSALPNYQGISPGQNPVLPLDVFLVQVILWIIHIFLKPYFTCPSFYCLSPLLVQCLSYQNDSLIYFI